VSATEPELEFGAVDWLRAQFSAATVIAHRG
jgi:hypothetical protein